MRPRRFWDEIEDYLWSDPKPKLLSAGVLLDPRFVSWSRKAEKKTKRKAQRAARKRNR